MEYSKKYRFLFIANPKTGSRAVRKSLNQWEADCLHNKRPQDEHGKIIIQGVPNHVMPYKLKKQMGAIYDQLKVFVFIRSPYGRAVSSYFFYKGGKTRPFDKITGGIMQSRLNFITSKLNYLLTAILPFSLYSVIKPFKTNKEYLVDESGNFIVNFIGKTENLNADLVEIGRALGLETGEPDKVERVNQSNHKEDIMDYFSKGWHLKLFNWKYKKEIELYNRIAAKPANHDWRNEKLF